MRKHLRTAAAVALLALTASAAQAYGGGNDVLWQFLLQLLGNGRHGFN